MRRLIALICLAAALVFPAATYAVLDLKISDHGTTCAVINDDHVNCIGKLSGLGSTTTTIEVLADFTCTNKPGNTVVGQSGGQSGPITPQNGQVTFNVDTASVSSRCSTSDDHTPSFGAFATINVYQNGQLVFTEKVFY
jgi:hypothetical protein